MSADETPLVVTPGWLAANLGADNKVRVLDGSWHLPPLGRDPAAEFLEAHIPGAAFFDIDGICDPDSSLPHMLPSPELFADSASALGIDNESHVVAYDTVGLYSAARVWWMFRVFGHERVSILAGGLPRWRAEGHPVESGEPTIARGSFTASARNEALVRSFEQVRANLDTGSAQIVDARAAARFTGEDPGPGPIFRAATFPAPATCPSTLSSTMTTLRWVTLRLSDEYLRTPESILPGRLSPLAGRASPRAHWRLRSPQSAPKRWPSTTAPGAIGAAARTRRLKAAVPPRRESR